MLDRHHEAFFPPTQNCTIWRYIDFTKFVSLLENQELVFPRADQLDDPYEGAISRESVKLLRAVLQKEGAPPQAADVFLQNLPRVRQEMFLSCWYVSDHESAAMWKLYLQSSEGVAIRSDSDALSEALDRAPLKGRISLVRYVDYEQTPIPFGNLFFPYVHKRLSFAHENELRAVIWSIEDANKTQISADATTVSIDIKPTDLIKSVHVSPTAPRWFGGLVEQILKRYGCTVPVVRSNLYDRPIY
jgi:hypothetical protein